jgi:hypothetical protein
MTSAIQLLSFIPNISYHFRFSAENVYHLQPDFVWGGKMWIQFSSNDLNYLPQLDIIPTCSVNLISHYFLCGTG